MYYLYSIFNIYNIYNIYNISTICTIFTILYLFTMDFFADPKLVLWGGGSCIRVGVDRFNYLVALDSPPLYIGYNSSR